MMHFSTSDENFRKKLAYGCNGCKVLGEAGSGDSLLMLYLTHSDPIPRLEKQCNLTFKQKAKINNVLIYELRNCPP